MPTLSRDSVRGDLIQMLKEIRADWDYSVEITEETGLFRDLGFESIDAVALGSALEEHFNRTLPFAEFLTKARDEYLADITVGYLLGFLVSNLNGSLGRQPS